MKRIIVPVLLLLACAACTKIDYVGEEYPPTTNVDLYFAEADVERDYKIMGRVVATAEDYTGTSKMQDKIMEEACKKGADGVVILGLERYQSGESHTYKETTETENSKKGSKSTTTATTKTDIQEKKEITALFIKYR